VEITAAQFEQIEHCLEWQRGDDSLLNLRVLRYARLADGFPVPASSDAAFAYVAEKLRAHDPSPPGSNLRSCDGRHNG
jgi:hypothetical protein